MVSKEIRFYRGYYRKYREKIPTELGHDKKGCKIVLEMIDTSTLTYMKSGKWFYKQREAISNNWRSSS